MLYGIIVCCIALIISSLANVLFIFSTQAANPGCLLADFVRWYSPRDWVEGEEEDDDCPPSDSAKTTTAATATNSSPSQQTPQPEELKNDNVTTEEDIGERSSQATSNVVGRDTEMEVGEAAIEGGEGGEASDGWDTEGWGEEDWDMIDNGGEEKPRQENSPSRDNSVTESPAIKVRKYSIVYSGQLDPLPSSSVHGGTRA